MKSKAENYYVLGHHVSLIRTQAAFDMAIVTSQPGVPGPPVHYHEQQQELFYVMKGTLNVLSGEQWITLSEGESAVIPPGVVHTFNNEGPEETVVLTTLSPEGFDGFFRAFGVPDKEENAFQRSTSEEVIARVILEAATYGMIITG